jgi:hypothetical protein
VKRIYRALAVGGIVPTAVAFLIVSGWQHSPVAQACCGAGGPVVPPTPAEAQFVTDAKNDGVVGNGPTVDYADTNLRSAGYLLCDAIWVNPNHEINIVVLQRLITYRDYNQISALAQQDLCPHAPPWS